jgi:phosphatidylglycerophosphate synthase
LDAIDGKQARRTGSSSPLGELFDHGCDSLSTVFVALATVIAVQLGDYPNLMFYQCMAASTLFYTAHWQTYVSGTLYFGRFDVTEAQFTLMAIHLITAVFGSSLWKMPIPLGFETFELRLVMIVFTLGGAVVNILWYLSSIRCGGIGKNGSTIAGTSIISPLMPIAAVIVPAITIHIKSPTSLYETNPVLYLLTFGLVIVKVTNKLVVCDSRTIQ